MAKEKSEVAYVLVTRNVNTKRGHVGENTPLEIGKNGPRGIDPEDAATLLNHGKAVPLEEAEYKKLTKGDKPEGQ